jgi:ribonuclease T
VNSLPNEFFISVDVETAGPVPSKYSMLSIGACTVAEPEATFYIELKPVSMNFRPEALAVSGLSLEKLAEDGVEPGDALQQFADWLEHVTPAGDKPIFVGFNAAFDWMFVNDYFQRYLQKNPFGHAALDIKSYYMGLTKKPWKETTMRYVGQRYLDQPALVHHALQDAIDQAVIFRRMLEEAQDNPPN